MDEEFDEWYGEYGDIQNEELSAADRAWGEKQIIAKYQKWLGRTPSPGEYQDALSSLAALDAKLQDSSYTGSAEYQNNRTNSPENYTSPDGAWSSSPVTAPSARPVPAPATSPAPVTAPVAVPNVSAPVDTSGDAPGQETEVDAQSMDEGSPGEFSDSQEAADEAASSQDELIPEEDKQQYKDDIIAQYQRFLNRTPSDAEIAGDLMTYATYNAKMEDASFLNSDEYKSLQAELPANPTAGDEPSTWPEIDAQSMADGDTGESNTSNESEDEASFEGGSQFGDPGSAPPNTVFNPETGQYEAIAQQAAGAAGQPDIATEDDELLDAPEYLQYGSGENQPWSPDTSYLEDAPEFAAEAYQAPDDFSYQEFVAPTGQEALSNDPGYQFRLDQGRKALEASAAHKGTLRSGATLKGLMDYGQGAASQEYQNVYDRKKQSYDVNRANAAGAYATNLGKNYDAYGANYGRLKDQYYPKSQSWANRQKVLGDAADSKFKTQQDMYKRGSISAKDIYEGGHPYRLYNQQ